MRRFAIGAAIFVAIIAAIAVAVRQSLADGRLHAAAESRLSAMLGQSVSIGPMGVEIFPRIAVIGGNVRIGRSTAQAPALDIERVRVLPRLGSLWTRPVAIERIELDRFVVSILRDRERRWHVPPIVPMPSGRGGNAAIVERVRVTRGRVRVFDQVGSELREASSLDDLDAEVAVENGGLRLSPVTGRVGRATVTGDGRTDGEAVRLRVDAPAVADEDLPAFLRLLGTERPPFLRLPEAGAAAIDIQVNRASSRLSGTGKLRAPQVLLGAVRLQRFEAPFAVRGAILEFHPTSFTMHGGEHRGTVTLNLADAPPSWTTDSRVNGLAVADFLGALTGRDQRVDGSASMTAALRGRVGEPLDRTMRGRVELVVRDGIIKNFPLLAAIDRALRLEDKASGDTRFERLAATLSVAVGQATTDDLVLEAGDVRVEAAGRIGADRSLELRGRAIVSAARAARAVASVHEIARLRNSRGEIELPLTIAGNLDAPAISVDVKTTIIEGIADEIRRRLRGWVK